MYFLLNVQFFLYTNNAFEKYFYYYYYYYYYYLRIISVILGFRESISDCVNVDYSQFFYPVLPAHILTHLPIYPHIFTVFPPHAFALSVPSDPFAILFLISSVTPSDGETKHPIPQCLARRALPNEKSRQLVKLISHVDRRTSPM